MYSNKSLKQYLDDLAAKKPAPGGGSAAALVGALAVALLSMVANFTIGKEKYKVYERDIKNILKKSQRIRKRLLQLVDLDVQAYMCVVEARDKSEKHKKIALKKAACVPFEVARLCYEAINLCPTLIKKGNKNLVSDVQVAAEFLLAAFNSALINVKINK
ncbi:MAG: cyclodeaminase/cyclohydrolase family protein [Candidatus Omnitrophota bacterium]|nr:cyclodeaminase/cyclohydrolase family protein [Candidatus Omnitrophota bacterium]